MFQNLKTYHEAGEKNWWSEVVAKMERYHLVIDLDEIQSLSKGVFCRRVKKAVNERALADLHTEIKSLRKTSDLHYPALEVQDYLLKMPPNKARVIFRWRSKTLDIKTHLTYKYEDTICRGCGTCEENVELVMNCGHDDHLETEDVCRIGLVEKEVRGRLETQASRVLSFLEAISP